MGAKRVDISDRPIKADSITIFNSYSHHTLIIFLQYIINDYEKLVIVRITGHFHSLILLMERRMNLKRVFSMMMCATVVFMFGACGGGSDSTSGDSGQIEDNQNADESASDSDGSSGSSQGVSRLEHDDPADYQWDDSEIIPVTLNGDTIDVNNAAGTVNGSVVTLTSAGTYRITGTLTDGQIIVDTTDQEIVRLILAQAEINCLSSAPIYVRNSAKTMIVLEENTENVVTDGVSYLFEEPEEEEPNAAIFSKSDLTVYGTGTLNVTAAFNDGIASKDGLIITSGTLIVNAQDDGIRGKDYLVVKAGNITINALGDGFTSDNEEDDGMGYAYLESGTIDITAAGDGIQAASSVTVLEGDIELATGGGSDAAVDFETASAKGIKAATGLYLDGGTFIIDSADDAIHSNQSVEINSGTFDIASGDDGIHADASIDINGGDIRLTRSYEGIESAVIVINGGVMTIASSDDGINVAGGADGSSMGRPGQGDFSASGNQYLHINGGTIVVDSAGDGLDVNGALEITGGSVVINGPTSNDNGALDYASCYISGGLVVAAGSSGMAQIPGSDSSPQNSLLLNFDSSYPAESLIHIESEDGNHLLTFAPSKNYQSLAFSSPDLASGASYLVYTGGSSSGTADNGLYQDGTYSRGTLYTTFSVSDAVTYIGGGFPMGPR